MPFAHQQGVPAPIELKRLKVARDIASRITDHVQIPCAKQVPGHRFAVDDIYPHVGRNPHDGSQRRRQDRKDAVIRQSQLEASPQRPGLKDRRRRKQVLLGRQEPFQHRLHPLHFDRGQHPIAGSDEQLVSKKLGGSGELPARLRLTQAQHVGRLAHALRLVEGQQKAHEAEIELVCWILRHLPSASCRSVVVSNSSRRKSPFSAAVPAHPEKLDLDADPATPSFPKTQSMGEYSRIASSLDQI